MLAAGPVRSGAGGVSVAGFHARHGGDAPLGGGAWIPRGSGAVTVGKLVSDE